MNEKTYYVTEKVHSDYSRTPYTVDQFKCDGGDITEIKCTNCNRVWMSKEMSPNETVCFDGVGIAQRTDFFTRGNESFWTPTDKFAYVNVCDCGCALSVDIILDDRWIHFDKERMIVNH